ncbi:MAG: hypothetical protein BHW48_15250 [Roseburia sp. CAG:10041_57]|nr:MAG: hypothetical protein BHW48_15250 [Roseburia sp. CAG:10041_57]DAY92708.1 MAG TPA: ribonuclease HI [Caudoviricetes sp.]
MRLKHVDIYITHNVRGFKTEHGTYGYTLTFQKQDGELKTIEDYASVGETTQNGIILTAMEKALGRMTTACEIVIYEDSAYIANMFSMGQLRTWYVNGFRNAKGKKVVDADKWREIEKLCRQHVVTVEFYTHHAFTDHMKYEIRKRIGSVNKNAGDSGEEKTG